MKFKLLLTFYLACACTLHAADKFSSKTTNLATNNLPTFLATCPFDNWSGKVQATGIVTNGYSMMENNQILIERTITLTCPSCNKPWTSHNKLIVKKPLDVIQISK